MMQQAKKKDVRIVKIVNIKALGMRILKSLYGFVIFTESAR